MSAHVLIQLDEEDEEGRKEGHIEAADEVADDNGPEWIETMWTRHGRWDGMVVSSSQVL